MIACEWIRTTAPVIEPITLTEAKLQAHVTASDEDSLITSDIQAAREAAEDYLGRGLLTQTWKMTLGGFADFIWLPMAAPLQSVSSVKYYDVDGTLQTLATSYYTVDTTSQPGRIVRAPNQTWPSVQTDRLSGPVEITYVVGWTAANLVPESFKQGIKLFVSYLFADREGSAEAATARQAAENCWRDRVYWKEPVNACEMP